MPEMPAGMRVLVVDDSPMLRMLTCMSLQGCGCAITEADRVSVALDLLASGPFDVIVTDMVMPDATGMDLVRTVRSSVDHASTPIVMLTSDDDPGTVREALEAGAQEVIVRPVDPEALLNAVIALAG